MTQEDGNEELGPDSLLFLGLSRNFLIDGFKHGLL
jgi:hypothetical protein